MHFIYGNEINFPYLFLSSLRKIASSVQRETSSLDNALYHHGIIKILIEAHLESKRDNWHKFPVHNHFVEVQKEETSIKIKRSRRRSISTPSPKEESEK